MAVDLTFRDLEFSEDTEQNNFVRVNLLGIFYFKIPKKELEKIGKYNQEGHKISFDSKLPKKEVEELFNLLIARYINNSNGSELGLKSSLNNKPAIYVHTNSGIPLFGINFFGIIDKGTDMIEIKPLTGCNLNCSFCSVDEGKDSKKSSEFVVECEYVVDELKKLLDWKKEKNIGIYINPHGEPLLYKPIAELIEKISEISWVSKIVIITNGALLNKSLTDKFAEIKNKSRKEIQLNISISAVDNEKVKLLMGTKGYDINKIKKEIEYAAKKIEINLTPVLIEGINDEEMDKIIEFAKESGCKEVKIQNFLYNKRGRNPAESAKVMPWKKFEKKLEALEKKHNIKLIFKEKIKYLGLKTEVFFQKLQRTAIHPQPQKAEVFSQFLIRRTAEMPKPFKTGETIKARIICFGRYSNELIAVAGKEEKRCILIENTKDINNMGRRSIKGRKNIGNIENLIGKEIKVRITGCIHNLFHGELC